VLATLPFIAMFVELPINRIRLGADISDIYALKEIFFLQCKGFKHNGFSGDGD